MAVVIMSERPDGGAAAALILELEAILEPLYPVQSRHGYSVEKLLAQGVTFFVLRDDGVPAGCGGIQLFGTEYGELKRMYVRPQFRSRGFGKLLIDHLAEYARARGIDLLRLETGIHQRSAIGLYERVGFQRIPPFGNYFDDPNSLCYEKRIAAGSNGCGASRFVIESMQPSDWDDVRRIYLEGLATGQASFETEAPGWEQWNEARLPHSRFVARADGRVIAWAALSPISKRPCYAGVAEASVYVSADARGRGVGKALLEKLIEESERNGIWTLYGATFPENTASIRMQLGCGFRIVGRRERIARHHGVWRDTIVTERRSKIVGAEDRSPYQPSRVNA